MDQPQSRQLEGRRYLVISAKLCIFLESVLPVVRITLSTLGVGISVRGAFGSVSLLASASSVTFLGKKVHSIRKVVCGNRRG